MACAITVNFSHSMFVAQNMGIISNGFLACLIWGTIFVGKPFTLQYAMADLPREQWSDPALVKSCRFIAVIWAALLSFSAFVAYFKVLNPALYPEWIYFLISMGVMLGGTVFTSAYKKYKRNQRNSAV
jgi:carotenoid cleavage dioxygenase